MVRGTTARESGLTRAVCVNVSVNKGVNKGEGVVKDKDILFAA
jgi:hypothetical protein